MVIFSLIIYFPSLTRHSQTGSQAGKICQYLLGFSTINSVVSSQRLYNLSPQLQHPLLPLGNIPQYLSRWERINCQLPTCVYNTGVRCVWDMYSKVVTSKQQERRNSRTSPIGKRKAGPQETARQKLLRSEKKLQRAEQV